MERLPFLNRRAELDRINRALRGRAASLVVVYGRRRLGKSRLVREALAGRAAVYYVGDAREGGLQREELAREMDALVPGFSSVTYPDWGVLLERFFAQAPRGAVLALDELPSICARSPELPSVLQKHVDAAKMPARHLILSGSSQRMMQGLVLDASSPLYGRAREILKVAPLEPFWLGEALGLRAPEDVVEAFAVWGGVPRYWELARRFNGTMAAVRELVLDPLGVLHREPERLLADDMEDTARAGSVLALVAAGVHRLSEIGARLRLPATDLSRPLARLVDLGILARDTPFGVAPRDSKRSHYRIEDPFLRFWYRFAEPNRSRLEAGLATRVERSVRDALGEHVAGVWEDMVRARVPLRPVLRRTWGPASRLWGRGRDGRPYEIDVVAAADGDPDRVLVGEVKLRASARDVERLLRELRDKAARAPELRGRRIDAVLWILHGPARIPGVFGAADVVGRAR